MAINSILSNSKISFIGGGNMGRALIGGLIQNGLAASQISVVENHTETAAKLKDDFKLSVFSSLELAQQTLLATDVVMLAIKPQDFRQAAQALGELFKSNSSQDKSLFISIAAGINLSSMSAWLQSQRCIRAMPNTPALISKGITGLCANQSVSSSDKTVAETICGSVGKVVWVKDENQIDAITALSGSGPAYVFAFLEALQAAGEKIGLDAKTSRELAYETLLGGALLAHQSADSASALREKVTSKGGTTAAALQVLKEKSWQAILEEAIASAAKRSQAISQEFGNPKNN